MTNHLQTNSKSASLSFLTVRFWWSWKAPHSTDSLSNRVWPDSSRALAAARMDRRRKGHGGEESHGGERHHLRRQCAIPQYVSIQFWGQLVPLEFTLYILPSFNKSSSFVIPWCRNTAGTGELSGQNWLSILFWDWLEFGRPDVHFHCDIQYDPFIYMETHNKTYCTLFSFCLFSMHSHSGEFAQHSQ